MGEVSPENWQYLYYLREKNCFEDPSGFMLCHFSPIAGTSDPCLNIFFQLTGGLQSRRPCCVSPLSFQRGECPKAIMSKSLADTFTLAASQSCISDVSHSQVQQ